LALSLGLLVTSCALSPAMDMADAAVFIKFGPRWLAGGLAVARWIRSEHERANSEC
jgi:hypothetical protein